MVASLKIPDDLVRFAGGRSMIEISETTIGQALNNLSGTAPELHSRVVNQDGCLHAHLVILQNNIPLPHDGVLDIEINDKDILEIFLVASGG